MLVTRAVGAELVEGPQAPPGVLPPPSLPEPAGLPRRVVYETGRRQRARPNRGERQPIRVGGRLGFGALGRAAGPLPVRAAFALDVLAVARMPISRGRWALGLLPEFGYSLLAGAHHTRGNFFTAGMGLGVISGPATLGVIPRVVAGALDRERAIGVRTGLLAEASKDGGFSLELSHEALWLPKGAVIHDFRFILSLTVLLGRR